jgi:hypothetical protein
MNKQQDEWYKVIYMGFPMLARDLPDDGIECKGFWSWVPAIYFNGVFMAYEGNYLIALWVWLKGDLNE